MHPLEKSLRNQLEKTIKAARDTAESAARAALEQLGVGEAKAFAHLSDQERELRRKLRVHGRQLGDQRNAVTETQELFHLLEEVSYEHWHRMLFARFLAENNLLMYWPEGDDDPIDVDLETCQGLLDDGEEQAGCVWELAARFAARMLPQIFRLESPTFQLALPPEHQQKLERLLADLPLEVFTASDSLGWVYQFWQAKKKDEVNASEVKIGARELPAVTQLFTEPYMVSFLLDNSLGAWWVKQWSVGSGQSAVKARNLLQSAENEDELREFFSLNGVSLEYLRFIKTDNCTLKIDSSKAFAGDHWMPAGGWFEGWPGNLADLKTLDPCCGSGHFLVAAFLMLVPMRMARENLTARDAVAAVLRENIYGLELDQRCVELAAFALALSAWRYPGAEGYRPLPELNVACSGLSVSLARDEWRQLGLGKKNLAIALGWLYDTFKDAPVLGSLLNPAKTDASRLIEGDELAATLVEALNAEATKNSKSSNPEDEDLEYVSPFEDEKREVAVVAQGLAKAATLIAGQYQWVITNVPYLARGKQSDRLRDFCEKYYPFAKYDLATVFLERCLELCVEGGTSSIVLPQNWLFLTSYKKFREKLLTHDTWHLIARLGPGAFATISGEVVKAILITLSRGNAAGGPGGLFAEAPDHNLIRGLDVSKPRTAAEKATQLLTAEIKTVEQAKQLENPDARVALEDSVGGPLLEQYSSGLQGVSTSDNPRFKFNFWELSSFDSGWRWFQGGVDSALLYGGCDSIVWFSKLIELYEAARDMVYGENDFQEHRAASNESGVYLRGQAAWFRKGVAVRQMRALPVCLTQATPFDTNTAVVLPNQDAHLPAIWCFCSSPEYNEAVRQIDQSLKVTNATLVKVSFDIEHWTQVAEEKYPNGLPQPYTDDPTQWIFHGHPCASVVWDDEVKWTAHGPLRSDDTVLQVAVARLLGYRWPAELDADKVNGEAREGTLGCMELADEQRESVKRCEALLPFADDDGIVCIPPVRGEAAAADRLLNLLAAAYGDAWSNDILTQLLKSVDHAGKNLETWLREKFFIQHCKLFKHRPFIWHIWDGLADGFAALVNYHKLDKKLELILEGEAPYDIFLRWKPLNQQPLGWNPDLNDGVRLNIRPFMAVADVRKKGAGVLRDKPNLKWTKDRGKDVESAPWFHLGPTYNGKEGDRINDHHLTLTEKREAREKRLTEKREA